MATTTNNGWTTPDDTNLVKNGAADMRTLGQAIDTSIGTGLLAWQSYTPTVTGWTVGNGTFDCRYAKLGKTVFVAFYFVDGSTTAETTQFIFTLPPGLPARNGFNINGVGAIQSTPNALAIVAQNAASTTSVSVFVMDASVTYAKATNIATGVPGTWAAGDYIKASFTYETA